nr:MAG TPA: tail protein [Caudoviricetes sp.]
MAVNKVILNDETLIDLSNDTITASDLKIGYTAHDCSGEQITGTYVESGGSSGAGLPDIIEAGDTPIWMHLQMCTTRSDSSSEAHKLGSGRFIAPKNGTYRFTFVGWTNAASSDNGNKARVYLSTASNKLYSDGLDGVKAVNLPYNDADIRSVHMDVKLKAGQVIYFFGRTASSNISSYVASSTGTVHAFLVSVAWDNGCNNVG